jgi:hypothetical protein
MSESNDRGEIKFKVPEPGIPGLDELAERLNLKPGGDLTNGVFLFGKSDQPYGLVELMTAFINYMDKMTKNNREVEMAEIKLEGEDLQMVLDAAIMQALGETGKELLIKEVVRYLTTPSGSGIGSKTSPLMQALHHAAQNAAMVYIR